MTDGWVHQLGAKTFPASEDQETLGVAVQTSGGVNIGDINEIGQRAPIVRIGKGRKNIEWLPKPYDKVRVVKTHR
ncbi:MAG: hypothetical protein P8Q52_11980 [Acidimicrobiales bacterium]|nr:hypothetical protein [Acidimicrobiales bacterium]